MTARDPQPDAAARAAVIADAARLDALREADLLNAAPEASFDRLARLAARLLAAPVALINFVDVDRQLLKSAIGMEGCLPASRELPLVAGFCERVVETGRPLVLDDARLDPQLAQSLPVCQLGLIAYCGVPLALADGRVLGAFGVADRVPRRWTPEQLADLADLAGAALTEIELRRQLGAQRRTKQALRRSQDQLEHATLAANVGLWFWDLATDRLDWTPQCKRLFGLDDAAEIDYPGFLAALHPQDRNEVDGAVHAALASGQPYQATFRSVWPDGSVHWLNSRGTALPGDNGQPIAMTGAVFDVTAGKHAELKLRASEHGLRAINDSLQNQVEARTAELQNLSRHLLHVIENEKSRLASELHDELGAYLTVLRMDLAAIQRGLRSDAPALLPRLDRALATLAETTDIKRRIVEGLRPSLIDTLGLEKALQMLVEQFAAGSGLSWQLDVEPELPLLDEHRAIALYRIVQEALNNSAKYARARRVGVDLREVAGGLRLTVTDDGCGLPEDWRGRPGSHGIAGMRQRVEFFGGRFEIGPGPKGVGTQIVASVPRGDLTLPYVAQAASPAPELPDPLFPPLDFGGGNA
ncbi:PAS domain-containing protein [Derxia lacustris]|uniref:PAS domain-containing protein n=1 Tax=Derxia lacustris TaxID=764842 RepID=UPI000A1725F4|nr:PAS domain-containing protein [Derxia lacustris]